MSNSSSSTSRLFRGKSVLVIDDSPAMRQLVRSLLRQFGFARISEASDGLDALTQLDDLAVDVIICDWMMEPMDGLTFVQSLRRTANKEISSLPVLMLTSVANEGKVLTARDSGITEYLFKPISSNALLTRLTSIFANPRDFIVSKRYTGPDRRRRDEMEVRANGRRLSDRIACLDWDDEEDGQPAGQAIDYEETLDREISKLCALLNMCRDEDPANPETWRQIHRVAHDLKGQAPSFGYHAVGAIAKSLEELLEAVQDNPKTLSFAVERRVKAAQSHCEALLLVKTEGIMTLSPEMDALLERLSRVVARVERDNEQGAA